MSLPDGRKVIAFDFDGVIHDYHGWNGGKLGDPMPGMVDVVKRLQDAGAHVVLHTTRKAEDITPWLVEHGFGALDVYNEKWSRIDVFVDDRAVCFAPVDAWTPFVYADRLLRFEPHWRRAAAPAVACRHCDAGFHLMLLDKDGVDVNVSRQPVDVIGHAVDVYWWPCPLAPQPPTTTYRPYTEPAATED